MVPTDARRKWLGARYRSSAATTYIGKITQESVNPLNAHDETIRKIEF